MVHYAFQLLARVPSDVPMELGTRLPGEALYVHAAGHADLGAVVIQIQDKEDGLLYSSQHCAPALQHLERPHRQPEAVALAQTNLCITAPRTGLHRYACTPHALPHDQLLRGLPRCTGRARGTAELDVDRRGAGAPRQRPPQPRLLGGEVPGPAADPGGVVLRHPHARPCHAATQRAQRQLPLDVVRLGILLQAQVPGRVPDLVAAGRRALEPTQGTT
mmetsp:Transcript_78818/g.231293  ORF Transcript_78818/g.231293 Transcript_78818/m.231293 type:complete len:218 (+) Transcript_78818:1692-2345(+)